jgi:hypothetical protein
MGRTLVAIDLFLRRVVFKPFNVFFKPAPIDLLIDLPTQPPLLPDLQVRPSLANAQSALLPSFPLPTSIAIAFPPCIAVPFIPGSVTKSVDILSRWRNRSP